MMSLQRQLRRNTGLTLLAALAGLLLLVQTGVQRIVEDYVLSRLQHDAESLMVALRRDDDGQWQVDASRLSPLYARVQSGHYYRVVSTGTDLRSRSLWDYEFRLPEAEAGAGVRQYRKGLGDEHWLTWTQTIRLHDATVTLWVAEDIGAPSAARWRYGAWASLVLLATLLIVLGLQQWILRRGFRSLEAVRDAIRALRTGEASAVNLPVPEEVRPLVDEIERLLNRLQQRVTRSRHALGNLAHEMKRPLQRLRLLTDALPQDASAELNRVLQELGQQVERELKRARIVGLSTPGRQTALQEEVPALLAVLEKIYPACRLQAEYPSGLVLPQDRDDMLELLGNLLDNACKHGGTRVQLQIHSCPEGFHVRVSDNGPGIPVDALSASVQRGVRLDETVSGAGLGLSICTDIVASYDGQIQLHNDPAGGLVVDVILPAG